MGHSNINSDMDKQKKNLLFISGGVLASGALVTTVLLIRHGNRRKHGLLPPGGPVNFLTTNNNVLPQNFRNWNGGNGYLANAPRGIRNNNPGNLIKTNINWQGKLPHQQNKDRRFEMFIAPVYGVRAMIKDLKHDIEKGKNTVPSLIEEYAPRFENNTDQYIQTVCRDLKVSKKARLLPTKNTLHLLVLSITRIETGGNYVSNDLFEQAYTII